MGKKLKEGDPVIVRTCSGEYRGKIIKIQIDLRTKETEYYVVGEKIKTTGSRPVLDIGQDLDMRHPCSTCFDMDCIFRTAEPYQYDKEW